MELEAKKKTPRAREGFNKIIDIFSNSKTGTFITLCYLSSANIPKTLTGKNIDVDQFGTDIDNNLSPGTEAYKTLKADQQGGASNKNKIPVGVVKSSIIQFHFQNEEGYGKKYGETVTPAWVIGNISGEYTLSIHKYALTFRVGVENMADKRYTTYSDWCDIPQKGRNVYVNLSVQL
jgi:hypothetical protein